jgi:DNA-binding response OmpR family regulator
MTPSNDNPTALVLEDDKSLAKAISTKLRLSGFKTVSARSVDDALDIMIKQQPIDVIWLDHYLLGTKDGIDFATAVYHHDKWRYTPIYVVSNTASNDKVSLYAKLGIRHYYIKADHRLDEIITEMKLGIQ